jgi:hypothetical protein
MTSSSTKIQAAADGGTSTDRDVQEKPAGPVYGFARLRESELYHLMGLVQSAIDETEHSARTVQDKARERWMDHQGTSEPLDKHEISRLLADAYQCAIKAVNVLDEAATHWLDDDVPDEPIQLR